MRAGVHALEIADFNVRVDLRRRQRLVPEQLLDVADVRAAAQHRRCAGVPDPVREQAFLQAGDLGHAMDHAVHVPQISRYEAGGAMPSAETLIELSDVLEVGLDELVLGRNGKPAEEVRDVRLLERVRELEKLDRRFRETAIAVVDAIVVQGHQEAVSTRLGKRR